jgi:hypothetical protein
VCVLLSRLQGCGSAEASLQGWPRPACTAAQALRASWLGLDQPLLFNVTANMTALAARLSNVYASIQREVRRAQQFRAMPCFPRSAQ